MSIPKKTLDEIKKDPETWASKKTPKYLVKILQIFSDKYFNEGNPLVDDNTYDKLYYILEEKDPKNPFFKKIGSLPPGEKIMLDYYMPSLDKIIYGQDKSMKKMDRWIKQYKGPYFISDKLNGCSALLVKKNGSIHLYTRGDGEEGEDITFLIDDGYLINKTILKKLTSDIAIRGEIVCSRINYNSIPESIKKKNAQSTVTSVINSDNYNKLAAKELEFIAHAIPSSNEKMSDQMDFLDKIKFPHVNYSILKEIDENILEEYYNESLETTKYDLDGIVVIDNSKGYQNNENKNPKYAFAFKNYDVLDRADSKVIGVEWTYSKDSYVIPTVIIEPISLENTTVNRATAYNAKFIIDNGIGKGSIVTMIKGGSIIPEIVEVIQKSKPATENLPMEDIEWSSSGVDLIYKGNDEDILYEINKSKVIYFFDTLKVKALGPGTVDKLLMNGYPNEIDIIDVFINNPGELKKIKGFAQKNIEKISKSIQEAFDKSKLENIMSASNIFGRGMGETKIKLILDLIPDIMDKDYKVTELTSKLIKIKGIGDVSAKKFVENLKYFKEYYEELTKIIDINLDQKDEIKNEDGIDFEQKKYVLTGTRDKDIIQFIEKHNGIYKENFTNDTFMVIYKEGKTSNTMDKAKNKGITLISDIEFKKMYDI